LRKIVLSERDYSDKFLEALQALQKKYSKYPKFMIEIIAEDHGIPSPEVNKLIGRFRKNGRLKIFKNEGFSYRLNDFSS